eukprot:TRINITY_DN11512_c0_g1_i2.p1 TRINITY_DN11512_c0_g1~~TRINITY_DN11512_c0_g1_i2.p1  ORF type:complete len:217 (+),score=24.93 TRINITY_DN11512_c0_g1_i2:148-798(+)
MKGASCSRHTDDVMHPVPAWVEVSSFLSHKGPVGHFDIEGRYSLGGEYADHPTWVREGGDYRILFWHNKYTDRSGNTGVWCISDMFEGAQCRGFFSFPKADREELFPAEGLASHYMNGEVAYTIQIKTESQVVLLSGIANTDGSMRLECTNVAGSLLAGVDVDPDATFALAKEELAKHSEDIALHTKFVASSGRVLAENDNETLLRLLISSDHSVQ